MTRPHHPFGGPPRRSARPPAPAADTPAAGTGGPGLAADAERLAVLRVPAAEEHVALVRLCTLHLAGAAGLGAVRVSDLRLAVAEACGTFLEPLEPAPVTGVASRGDIRVRFDLQRDLLRIQVRGRAPAGWPDRGGLGWLVLRALVGDLSWERDGADGVLTLVEHLPAAEGFRFAAL